MRRLAALVVVGFGLLLSPGAPGLPDVPGDPTPPVVTPVITGTLGAAGWYTTNVTVNWTVVDPESIILSTMGCNAITLTTNTTGTQLACSAESDGGTTTVSKTLKVDKTAPAASATPSRSADSNGWYNHELTVGFAGTDGTSGLESCSADAAYVGPDTAGTTVSGTCRDRAGNTAPASYALKYDATAPQASVSPGRPADENGWYNHLLAVTFAGTDATSGVGSCDASKSYSTPDSASASLSGTCLDRAGNQSAAATFGFKYDATSPQVTAAPSRQPNANGWYRAPLTIGFTGGDATSGVGSCDAEKSYAGPDAASTSVGGTCRDQAGNTGAASFSLKYDATAPQATAAASRAANANGWYNAPLSVSFAATDATSGLESCPAAQSYSGPDSGSASVSGTCLDKAGNAGPASLALKYDATGPTLRGLSTKPGNRSVDIEWRASTDTRVVEVARAPGRNGAAETVVYRGAATTYRDKGLAVGRRYHYRVTAFDEATNKIEQAVDVVATGALLSPAPGQPIASTAPPNLVWAAAKGASYYNLQLIRGRKVLSAWPARPGFQLRRTWLYKGRRYRLRPGVYRWYVWPGFGRISAAQYGRLLGSSTFVVSG